MFLRNGADGRVRSVNDICVGNFAKALPEIDTCASETIRAVNYSWDDEKNASKSRRRECNRCRSIYDDCNAVEEMYNKWQCFTLFSHQIFHCYGNAGMRYDNACDYVAIDIIIMMTNFLWYALPFALICVSNGNWLKLQLSLFIVFPLYCCHHHTVTLAINFLVRSTHFEAIANQ